MITIVLDHEEGMGEVTLGQCQPQDLPAVKRGLAQSDQIWKQNMDGDLFTAIITGYYLRENPVERGGGMTAVFTVREA